AVSPNGLNPGPEISHKPASMGPDAPPVGLPERSLPPKILPLVVSINRALDRLEKGFAVQREFTANAAHKLRTPLAIVTSALETLEAHAELNTSRTDVARIDRLVERRTGVARVARIA